MIRAWLVFICLIFATSTNAYVTIDCTYKYRIAAETDIRICTYSQLQEDDLRFIKYTIDNVPLLYLDFLNQQHKQITAPIRTISRIDIGILTLEDLNNGSLPNGFRKNRDVIGRYYLGDRRVYVTLSSIQGREYVLAHEVAHYLNFQYGIADTSAEDERLAYAFEDFLAHR